MGPAERQLPAQSQADVPDTGAMRDRILHCARGLFAAQGYDATSVRQIAEAVGVTVPALYYHFASKKALLEALAEDHCLRKAAALEAGLKSEGNVRLRFERALTSYLKFMTGERETARIAMGDPTLLADPALFALVAEGENRIAGMLSDLITEGVEQGTFTTADPKLTSHLLLAAARSVALSRTLDRGGAGMAGTETKGTSDSDETLTAGLVQLVTQGLLSRTTAPSEE